MSETEKIYEAVRKHYALAAKNADCCSSGAIRGIGADNYGEIDAPSRALEASLGCGNPTALIDLMPGDVVLDLGSGGGLDVLLSARRVAPHGKAYGLDMTDEMLDLARRNQSESGIMNAEFLRGTMEHIPLPDASVDVIISNCVVNLSPDKDRVFAEAFRVLEPGGRLAISDIVTETELPAPVRKMMDLWGACVAGALSIEDYRAKLRAAGFSKVDIELTRSFGREYLGNDFREILGGDVHSAFVRAVKPGK